MSRDLPRGGNVPLECTQARGGEEGEEVGHVYRGLLYGLVCLMTWVSIEPLPLGASWDDLQSPAPGSLLVTLQYDLSCNRIAKVEA